MKILKSTLTTLMICLLMVGNIGWVINHLQGNEKALNALSKGTMNQDPRPIGLGNGYGLYK